MATQRSHTIPTVTVLVVALLGSALGAAAAARPHDGGRKTPVPLKEAKLNIEHNATDHDTGFQGFVDSEGWDQLEVTGPRGVVLRFEGRGALGELGLTELFFESVEPENADVPIDELLEDIPAGRYTFRGRTMIDGETSGETVGTAWLSHDIPAGPVLQWPAPGAVVSAEDLVVRWGAVTQTLRGTPANIVAYQLIVEKDATPHAHMIGKWGLSMYLPPSVTSMPIPRDFLEPGTAYSWEVLAIEESGNQTLSSAGFRTQ
jgi:hypothetical protein